MPLYWSFICERRGRRVVYLISMAVFVLCSALAATASSITRLVLFRIFAGFFACSVTIAGPAIIADIWDSRERGRAISVFYLGPLLGPAVGPLLGGILIQAWDWRACQWFLTVYAGLMLLLVLFLLPETRQHVPEQWDTATASGPHLKSRKFIAALKLWIFQPLRSIAYLRFAAISLPIYLASFSFSLCIIAATTSQEAFHGPTYRFTYLIVGLLFLPFSIGLILGGLISGTWSDRIMDREARASGYPLIHVPEARIKENAWISVVIVPAALVWYGWTLNFSIIWVVPVQ